MNSTTLSILSEDVRVTVIEQGPETLMIRVCDAIGKIAVKDGSSDLLVF